MERFNPVPDKLVKGRSDLKFIHVQKNELIFKSFNSLEQLK